MMLQQEPVKTLATQHGVTLPVNEFAANKKILVAGINELIQHDFQRLVAILYRLDVSEEKLKQLLKENRMTDAGDIITDLIIERQMQKIKSRQQFNQPGNDIDENEKW